jgi:hypothetical protein
MNQQQIDLARAQITANEAKLNLAIAKVFTKRAESLTSKAQSRIDSAKQDK